MFASANELHKVLKLGIRAYKTDIDEEKLEIVANLCKKINNTYKLM